MHTAADMKPAVVLLACLLVLPVVACGGAAVEMPPTQTATASAATDPEWNPGDGFDMKLGEQASPAEKTQLAQPAARPVDRPNMPSKTKRSLITLTHKSH
jgi:hypothetical protein